MASVTVETVVQTITVALAIDEARALAEFFSLLDPDTAPQVVREISRRFKRAVENETFVTPVD